MLDDVEVVDAVLVGGNRDWRWRDMLFFILGASVRIGLLLAMGCSAWVGC